MNQPRRTQELHYPRAVILALALSALLPTANRANGDTIDQVRLDLAITKTDGVMMVVPGETLTYTIVVSNLGPADAHGATVTDPFPPELLNVTYTSTVMGTATGNTAAGVGDINDTIILPVGDTITYIVTATVSPAAVGTIVNTATVATPPGCPELDPSNNTATDIDDLTPVADLSITKDDGVTSVMQGGSLTYEIVVENAGPSDAVGAAVADVFPAELETISFTSASDGGATGNAANGVGNISDTVNMPVGSRITYTVTADVGATATGTIVNTATIDPAAGTEDPDLTNNSASDSDEIIVPEPQPQPQPCTPGATNLNLLFSLLFHSPVCGFGCTLTVIGTFCGLIAMRTNRRRR